MKDRIPLVVVRERLTFLVRPLFQAAAHHGEARGPTLANALAQLQATLHRRLLHPQDLADRPPMVFATADLEPRYVRGRLDARGAKQQPFRALVVLQPHGATTFVHVPRLEFVFQREPTRALEDDVASALSRELEARRKRSGEASEHALDDGRSTIWLHWLHLPAVAAHARPRHAEGLSLTGSGIGSGAQELAMTSTRLATLDPEVELRCAYRDDLLEQLERHLRAPRRPALLLVGPPGAGKTALVHELAMRRTERQRRDQEPRRPQGEFWHLVPARLLAGMMYQGQWERRLEAILGHAQAQDLVLWFDDLLGLTTAGRSCGTTLVMADLFKAAIDDGRCRLLGEITPGALQVLRERHRALADAFEIVAVPAADPRTTRRLLLHTARHLEASRQVVFAADLLQQIPHWVARLHSGIAEPGRSLRALHRLARHTRHRTDFAAGEGEQLTLKHLRHDLPLPELVHGLGDPLAVLQAWIREQPAATTILADVATLAHCGLGDPHRPLQSLLFTGPTGVGKTESAKALVGLLFRAPRHLLRFDMNQYATYGQAQRLIGTFEAPDGHLTAAVRSTPAAVLLLDEIEKAHPTVHDLLLQVLGEGRLTDARGRTVDFRQVIVVMTSNLGAVEVRDRIGLGDSDATEIYTTAVRRFFRPEFCNRIDHIVPFRSLTRDGVAGLVDVELAKLAQRSGMQRRAVSLALTTAARDRLVDFGFHPQLGARALQRAIRDHVLPALAAPLAATTGQDHVLWMFRRGDDLVPSWQALPLAARRHGPDLAALLGTSGGQHAGAELVARAQHAAEALRAAAKDGRLPAQAADQLHRLFVAPALAALSHVDAAHTDHRRPRTRGQKQFRDKVPGHVRRGGLDASEIDDYLASEVPEQAGARLSLLESALRHLLLAEHWLTQPWPGPVLVHVLGYAAPVGPEQSIVTLRPFVDLGEQLEVDVRHGESQHTCFDENGAPQPTALVADGIFAAYLQGCAGTVRNLGLGRDGLVEVVVAPLDDPTAAAAELARARAERSATIDAIERGAIEPTRLRPAAVTFTLERDHSTRFLPTGDRIREGILQPDDFVNLLFASLATDRSTGEPA